MAKVLSRLKILEVSDVDAGANQHAKVVLVKRGAKPKKNDPSLNQDEKDRSEQKIDAYMKREFTTEQRRQMAHTGQAMSGGEYPIGNVKDLKNAIRAIGRAKKPGKTKSHIMSRARALGATRLLPDKWVRKAVRKNMTYIADALNHFFKSEGGEDFNTELGEMKSTAFGEGLQEAIHEACHAMKHSIDSIMEDDGTTDKGTAIRESYGQFLDHVQSLCPTGDVVKIVKRAKERVKMAKNFNKAYTSVGQSDSMNRTAEINAKTAKPVIDDDDDPADPAKDSPKEGTSAANKKLKAWKKRFIALAKLAKADKKSKDWMDADDNDMDDDDMKKFIDMSVTDRHAFIDANPIAGLTEKRMAALPEPLRKALEAGNAAAVELAKRADAENLTNFTKRATGVMLASPGEIAPHLVTLHKASPEATEAVMKAVETMVKAAKAQADTSALFKNFGVSGGGENAASEFTGDAYAELMAKAQQMADEGKAPTVEQAFAKLYQSRDPAIRTLVKRMKDEGSAAE